MAVVIASDLAKDMAGEPLLRGVSFKLERRDRLTIAGRNGAGKTTLLRMLAGEASVDAGVQARFEAVGGYTWRERANEYLHGLGFVDADLDRELKTFSGGQLTRASLARALAAEPDL